jgi:hypothetical protein
MRYVRRGPEAPRPELLYRARAGVPTAVVPVLVAIAVLGWVAGHAGGGGSGEGHARTAKTANVLIEYPPGWSPAPARRSPIPGLALARAQLLVPRAGASTAGLLVGALPARETGPLPAAFLERVRRQPQTSIVDLVELQAYRYSRLSVRGFARELVVFVVPNPSGASTVLACYAPSAASLYLRACEQTVASVTVAGQPQTYQLTPEAGYAGAISAAIAKLDGERVAIKRALRPQVSAAEAERLAHKLADGYATAGAALARLEPTFASVRAQRALTSAIADARAGYDALATAAAEQSVSAYTTAQVHIAIAENAVDRALEDFVLLGYSPALGAATGAHP